MQSSMFNISFILAIMAILSTCLLCAIAFQDLKSTFSFALPQALLRGSNIRRLQGSITSNTVTSCIARDPIPLWKIGSIPYPLGTEDVDIPTITPFLPLATNSSGVSILVIPGGGYSQLSQISAAPYAEWLCRDHGVASYVLKYRLASNGYHHPIQQMDGSRAMRLLRSLLRLGVDEPGKIGVIGSSAGGHLAATIMAYDHDATRQDPSKSSPQASTSSISSSSNSSGEEPTTRKKKDIADSLSSRPSFGALIYPVISMEDPMTDLHTKAMLLGPDLNNSNTAALVDYYSIEKHVTQDYPPTFLFHSKEDEIVPVGGSILMNHSLALAQVPHDFALWEHGMHALGLWGIGTVEPPYPGAPMHPWTDRCIAFLRSQGILPSA